MAATGDTEETTRVKWFYIKSASSDNVVSAAKIATDDEPLMRSQVYVCSPRHVDEEQWCWDGQHLVNKATELVLDIRKGRLRLIEDTDICMYSKKPEDEAHNQRWSVQDDDPNIPTYYICSQSNSGWVLDIRTDHQSGNQKLILSPHQAIDKDNQLWVFIPAEEANSACDVTESIATTTTTDDAPHTCCPSHAEPLVIRISGDIPHHFITEAYRFSNNSSTTTASINLGASLSRTLSHASTSSSHSLNEQDLFPVYGLTPAKRGSQSSATAGLTLNAFKECHQLVYLEHNPHLSDKTIAMAAAYHVWQAWKEQQVSLLTRQSGGIVSEEQEDAEKARARLQSMAQDEASGIFDQSDQLNNHKETALVLAKRLIISLCMMTPQSP